MFRFCKKCCTMVQVKNGSLTDKKRVAEEQIKYGKAHAKV